MRCEIKIIRVKTMGQLLNNDQAECGRCYLTRGSSAEREKRNEINLASVVTFFCFSRRSLAVRISISLIADK